MRWTSFIKTQTVGFLFKWPNTRIITGSGGSRKQTKLKPIYDILGPKRVSVIPGFHAVIGCDTTGHISQNTAFNIFINVTGL